MARKVQTNPRKLASQERSRATVDALLEATARILLKEGYDKASTNRIAEVAGVSIGSLYQYFPSKEALVSTAIRNKFRRSLARPWSRWLRAQSRTRRIRFGCNRR